MVLKVALTCISLVILLNLQLYWNNSPAYESRHFKPNMTGENTKRADELDICVFVDVARTVKLCPDTPSIVSSVSNGRFGNQIASLATLVAFNKKFGLRPVIYDYQMDLLVEYFEDVNIPVFVPEERIPESLQIHLKEKEDDTFNRYLRTFLKKLPSFLRVSLSFIREGVVSHVVEDSYYYEDILSHPEPFLKGRALDIGVYPNGFFFYKDYLKEIKEEFQIKREYLENAREVLKNIGKRYVGKTVIYVGVHVRRGDYERHLRAMSGNDNATYVKESYFKEGMERFRTMFSKQGEVVFVVLSEDVEWSLQHFQNDPGVFIGSFRAKAKASSQENPKNMAINVVDGVVDTKHSTEQFVSKTEAFPWLEIDLESQVMIDRVVIFPRGDHSQERFGNFQVRLGKGSLAQHLQNKAELSTHGYLCGQVEKNFTQEQPVNVKCRTPQSSRYILIQGTKPWMTLELGEVMWSAPGERLRAPSQQVSSPPVRDFALLSVCNHSLLTYGTFGQWAALYAGGHVIMPTGYTGETSEFRRANLTNWTFLGV